MNKRLLRKVFFAGVVIGGSVVAYHKEILNLCAVQYAKASKKVEDAKVVDNIKKAGQDAVNFVKKAPGVVKERKFDTPEELQEFLDWFNKTRKESESELNTVLAKVRDVATELELRVSNIVGDAAHQMDFEMHENIDDTDLDDTDLDDTDLDDTDLDDIVGEEVEYDPSSIEEDEDDMDYEPEDEDEEEGNEV